MEGLYCYKYPHPAVTTDCVVFGYDPNDGLSVLLIRRGIEPFKDCWALPGGFVRIDEEVEACARRELNEETGLQLSHLSDLKELGCYSGVNRDPRERVITIAYYQLVRKSEVKGGDDAKEARWFPVDNLPEFSFDHKKIVEDAIERLNRDIYFEPIGFNILPEVFTMPQLYKLYKSILKVDFDRRNFANKMMKLGVVGEVGNRPQDASRRTPIQYMFNKERYDMLRKAKKAFRLEF
jgi:8-oxo-dGTP diphosphatase